MRKQLSSILVIVNTSTITIHKCPLTPSQCDLFRPACGQCLRAHLTCSGYRNQVDLLFHDQTDDVARKAQQHKQTSHRKAIKPAVNVAPAHSRTPPPDPEADFLDLYNATILSPATLQISAESQAFCFFFTNYPSQPSRNFGSVYEEIPALYCMEASDSSLLCVVTALGLVGLSHHAQSSGMEVAASAWYEKALHKINNSLRNQEEVALDQTLLVVLLLSLYEVCAARHFPHHFNLHLQTNTCTTSRSMKSWLKHINGATALLELRGEAQLESEFGRTLFAQARTQIIAGCYQTRSPVPQVVVQLSEKCSSMSTDPLENLNSIAFRLCNLKAATSFHPPSTQSESTTRIIIARCTSIAEALTAWHAGLANTFHPTTVFNNNKFPDILSSYHDIYEDIWTGGINNNYRANSILVHETLINQLLFLLDKSSNISEILSLKSQLSQVRATIIDLVDAVCASVPNLLQSHFAAAGVALLWPLYLSGQISQRTAPLPATTRAWIIGRLEKICKEMGVRQAGMLAGLLRQRIEVTELLV